MILSVAVIKTSLPPLLTNKWTDWNGFKEDTEQRIELNVRLKTTVQLDMEVEKLLTDVQQAKWNNTPEFKRTSPG